MTTFDALRIVIGKRHAIVVHDAGGLVTACGELLATDGDQP